MASRVEATGMRDTSLPVHRLDPDDGQQIYRQTAPPNRISGQDTVSAHLGTQRCQGWRFPLRGTWDRPLVSTTRNIDIPPVKTRCAMPFGQLGAGVKRRVCRMAGKPQGAIFPSIRDETGLISQRTQPNHPPFPFCRPNRIGDFVPTCSAPAKIHRRRQHRITQPLQSGSSPVSGNGWPRMVRSNTMPSTRRYRVRLGC